MKLFEHQERALQQTEGQNRVAYYLDMGLGKTFIGSEKAKELGSNVILLVCQKSKVQDWIDHFETNYSNIHVLDFTQSKQYKLFNDRGYKVFLDNSPEIYVINYELAWRRKKLKQLQNFTLMLDESSLIQNQTAKQSKFIMQLNPSNVILLSGTPCSGKYENLWTQIHLLGWNISEDLYNKQYVNWVKVERDGYIHKEVDKENPYKNIERLKNKLREHGAVFMKTEEVFDLPEQTFIKKFVPTSKEYWKFVKNDIISIDTLNLCEFKDESDFYGKDVTPFVEMIGDTSLKKRLHCRQLCGMYSKEKLSAFKELVESTQDRLIVFYNYTAEYLAMVKIAEQLGRPQSIVNGQQKQLINYENCDNSITFVQYQAGAKGLNLQKANKIIYFSLTDKVEDWMQSQKRIHRIGQNKPCFYYILMCRGSVEEKILDSLERGVDYTDELFRQDQELYS